MASCPNASRYLNDKWLDRGIQLHDIVAECKTTKIGDLQFLSSYYNAAIRIKARFGTTFWSAKQR